MKKFYISCGQSHAHSVSGRTFDKDYIAVIHAEDMEQARKNAFNAFGPMRSMMYTEEKPPDMSYFPRGVIGLERCECIACIDSADPVHK